MWSETAVVWGLQLPLTYTQLAVVLVFAGLALGYALALIVNRRKGADPGNGDAGKGRMASNMAFMKGINYILSDKPGKAIEELTRAVSVDTETVETYVALGNLFRRQGEIDRAIRIRQSIILRPNLDAKIRRDALCDLGVDYHHGGFYERAVTTLEEVLSEDPKREEALRELVLIYEETRDWEKAFETVRRLDKLTGDDSSRILAHYQVEMGKNAAERGRPSAARAAYKKALSLDAGCVDAYLHMGDLSRQEGKPGKAVEWWRRLIDVAPDMVYLTFGRLAWLAAEMKDIKPAEDFLAECAHKHENPLARVTLARLYAAGGRTDEAADELRAVLNVDPSIMEARREYGRLLLVLDRREEALADYRDLLENLAWPEAAFECERCGFESNELMWRCPQCYTWDSMGLTRYRPAVLPATRPAAELHAAAADESPAPAAAAASDGGEESG